MQQEKKMRVIKLSKENQKRLQGGSTRAGNCSSWSCVGAMDAYVTSYYRRN